MVNRQIQLASGSNQKPPEPPVNFDPQAYRQRNENGSDNGQHDDGRVEFSKVRRFVIVSQVLALVSLLIGGVMLSSASLVVALIGNQRACTLASQNPDNLTWTALKRSSTIAIILAVGAIALNIIALVVLYPMVVEMLQSGNFELFGTQSGSAFAPETGNSTWG